MGTIRKLRGVAQLVEHSSPKRAVGGSTPPAPAVNMPERAEDQPRFIETIVVSLPWDTQCVKEGCSNKLIKAGEEALQSPSTPGFFYHLACFRELIREAGKNPDTFLRIININPPSRN